MHSNDGKSQNEKNGKKEEKEKSKKDKTLKYLSQIDKQKRDQLFEIYKHDFEMFDYDPYHIWELDIKLNIYLFLSGAKHILEVSVLGYC